MLYTDNRENLEQEVTKFVSVSAEQIKRTSSVELKKKLKRAIADLKKQVRIPKRKK